MHPGFRGIYNPQPRRANPHIPSIRCPTCRAEVWPRPGAHGDAEYVCVIGGHGHVAIYHNGRVEWTGASTDIIAHCVYPGCPIKTSGECDLSLCRTHCLELPIICGCPSHDTTRRRRRGEDNLRDLHEADVLIEQYPEALKKVTVILEFTDRNVVYEAEAPCVYNTVRISTLPTDVQHALHTYEVYPNSYTVKNRAGGWVTYNDSKAVRIPPDQGRIEFRARSVEGATKPFPLYFYVDMSNGFENYETYREDGVSRKGAWCEAFPDCDEDDFDETTIDLVRQAWLKAPRDLHHRYLEYGRTDKGRWADFARDVQSLPEGPFDYFDDDDYIAQPKNDEHSSPAAEAARRRAAGKRRRDSPSEETNAKSKKRKLDVVPATVPRRRWLAGPAAEEAGPSRARSAPAGCGDGKK